MTGASESGYPNLVSRATIWLGPVSRAQIAGAVAPNSTLYVVPGDGSTYFSTLAESWHTPDGRYLPGLLAKLGIPSGTEIFVGSFSAGHGAVRKLLLDAQDRAEIRAVLLADSTYSSWTSSDRTAVTPVEGYVRFALDAIANPNEHLFLASASNSPNGEYPNGSDTLAATAGEVVARAGQPLGLITDFPAAIVPAPPTAGRIGSAWFLDYAGVVTHPEHATLLAPQIWANILNPWLNRPPPTQVASTGGGGFGAIVALGALAVGAVALLRGRRR
jgi:hypothetical protein